MKQFLVLPSVYKTELKRNKCLSFVILSNWYIKEHYIKRTLFHYIIHSIELFHIQSNLKLHLYKIMYFQIKLDLSLLINQI